MSLKVGLLSPQTKVKLPGTGKVSPRIADLFEAYRRAYKEEHGESVQADMLLEALLGQCFDTDKGFQAYLKRNPINGSPAAGRRTPRAPASGPTDTLPSGASQ